MIITINGAAGRALHLLIEGHEYKLKMHPHNRDLQRFYFSTEHSSVFSCVSTFTAPHFLPYLHRRHK